MGGFSILRFQGPYGIYKELAGSSWEKAIYYKPPGRNFTCGSVILVMRWKVYFV
jgi:hypothetical protein